MPLRAACVRLHRYFGLATAGFLLVAGLTGTVLAFGHELDRWLNPQLFHSTGSGERIATAALIARIEARDPRLRVISAPLAPPPGESLHLMVRPRVDPATGRRYLLDFDELFVDPAGGRLLGTRSTERLQFTRAGFVPLIYRLHYSLWLPHQGGIILMGLVALVWALDNIVALYLTFPASRRQPGALRAAIPTLESLPPRSWRQRWAIAWRIKRGGGIRRLQLDLHRAPGLWFYPLLLVLAVSGLSFNLRDELFEPAVALFSPLTPSPFNGREERTADDPLEPSTGFAEILDRAAAAAAARGWQRPASAVFYNPLYGIYGVLFGEETAAGLGPSYLYFDGGDGRLLGDYQPWTGTAGDRFLALQLPLHSGRIAGLPGRIAIALTGLAVALLSVTGVSIWLHKRRARRHRAGRTALAAARDAAPSVSLPTAPR